MTILTNNKSILLETYYGKAKEFIACENELKKIIKFIKEDENKSFNETRFDISNLEANKNIEKIITHYFKIKNIKLYWTTSAPNAMTIKTSLPIVYFENKSNKDRFDKYINKNLDIYIFLDTNLVRKLNMNEKEIMGILLHEIGHNFTTTPFYFISTIPIFLSNPISWALIGFVGKGISEISIFFNSIIKKYLPFLDNLIIGINDFIYHISGPSLPVIKIDVNMLINTLLSFFGYGEERFSDSFAATYGYGPDLSTALGKLETQKDKAFNKIIDNIPIINVVNDFIRLLMGMCISIIDEHPQSQTRMKNIINKLKRDLNDPSIPKDLRIEIENNIRLCEDYYTNFISEDENKGRFVTYLAKQFNDKWFDGKLNPKELLNKWYEMEES